jgi:hypothetical protein
LALSPEQLGLANSIEHEEVNKLVGFIGDTGEVKPEGEAK